MQEDTEVSYRAFRCGISGGGGRRRTRGRARAAPAGSAAAGSRVSQKVEEKHPNRRRVVAQGTCKAVYWLWRGGGEAHQRKSAGCTS